MQVCPSRPKFTRPGPRGTSTKQFNGAKGRHFHYLWQTTPKTQLACKRISVIQKPESSSLNGKRIARILRPGKNSISNIPRSRPNHSAAYSPPEKSGGLYLSQRALDATLAISIRLAGVSFFALALPPFNPPALRLDGWRFDSLTVSSTSPMAMSNTCLASWAGSRGRLATN